jgi:integrase
LRTVSVSSEIVDMLRRLRIEAGRARMALGLGGRLEDAYVLTREDGESPLRPDNISDAFRYHVRKNGLPERFTFHGTRHTHLTVLLRKVGQAGAKAVSERAGHADITTTLRVYQSVFESDDRNLADLSAGIIKGRKT